jgi:hypothetical protein
VFTSNSLGQPDLSVQNSSGYSSIFSSSGRQLKDMLTEGSLTLGIVIWSESPFQVVQVASREIDGDVDYLS